MATINSAEVDEPVKKQVQDFFSIDGKRAKCLVADCRSELGNTRYSHLIRHIELMHVSKLAEIEELPVNKMNLGVLRESTICLCVRHVTVCGRPLSSLNDESFRTLLAERMLRLGATNHKLTINSQTVRNKLEDIYTKMQKEIENEVEGKQLSFAMDIASRHNRSILGVSLQYIVDTKLITRTIMMEKILKRHNKTNLSLMFKKALAIYNIPLANVFALCTDSGSNMIATTNELDFLSNQEDDEWFDGDAQLFEGLEQEHRYKLLMDIAKELYDDPKFKPFEFQKVNSVRCGAHTLQLAVGAALKESQCSVLGISSDDLIDSARNIVKTLRNSIWLIELDKNGVPIPVPDNKTRWFSKYIMVS